MPLAAKSAAVEEFVGLYGPYQVSELVLQRIWLEGAFDLPRLADGEGRAVRVVSPGHWNRLDGPDFKGAVVQIGDETFEGDVEVHFAEGDWRQHGHDKDPAYDGVVLHVVYRPPQNGKRAPVETSQGKPVPTAALLPLLWYSLEEYASDDSIVGSAGVEIRAELEPLLALDVGSRRRELAALAKERWELKLHFARQRVERLGWEGACHQSALEILGYSKNRIPMLLVAGSYGVAAFAGEEASLEALWSAGRDKWRLRGCRPANHPRARLLRYRDWAQERPDWPLRLRRLFPEFAVRAEASAEAGEMGSAGERKRLGVVELARRVEDSVLAGSLSGARAATLAADGFLPLLGAETGTDLFPLWFHWPMGDGPESCAETLRRLRVVEPRVMPSCNGWLQGALALRNRAG